MTALLLLGLVAAATAATWCGKGAFPHGYGLDDRYRLAVLYVQRGHGGR